MDINFKSGLILSLVELVGDYGAVIQKPLIAYGGYFLLAHQLLSSFRVGASLTLTNAYWDSISNLCTIIMGYMLGERFSPRQYVGIVFVSIGIFLLKKI